MKLGLLLLMLVGSVVNFESEKVAPPATLVFVGDIMLSRGVGRLMEKKNDWQYPFLEIKDTLAEADLLIGNLEGPISSKGVKIGSIYSFRVDPRAVAGLTGAGFDVLSLANNHLWDYGRDAFNATLNILRNNGIDYIGGGIDYAEAHQPLVREVKGTKVAFLAYTDLAPAGIMKESSKPAVAFSDLKQIIPDIAKAKTLADLVIVSFHWGNEYETKHNQKQEALAHAVIDAGANLVIGHHPHVAQEVEKYKDGYIAYSLGNFVFDQNFSTDTRSGLMLKVTIKDKKIEKTESQRIKFTSTYQPKL
jgi:poly-gamma-glutamate synthesis protein (capsule biosynthesis protein)